MKKTKIIIGFMILVLMSVSFYSVFAQEKSWEGGRLKDENKRFIAQVDEMQNGIEKMIENINVSAKKYCNKKGCWEIGYETEKWIVFEGKNEEKLKIANNGNWLSFDNKNASWTSDGKGVWLKYHDLIKKDTWDSDSSGKGTWLNYKDSFGNKWKSNSEGDWIEFNDKNGDYWISDDKGTWLKYNDENKKWGSYDNGIWQDYEDAQGNKWTEKNLVRNR